MGTKTRWFQTTSIKAAERRRTRFTTTGTMIAVEEVMVGTTMTTM